MSGYVLVGRFDARAARLAHQSPEAQAMHEQAWHFHRSILKAGVGGRYGTHKDGNPMLATQEQVSEANLRVGGYSRMIDFIDACIQHNIEAINAKHGTGDLGPWQSLRPMKNPAGGTKWTDKYRQQGYTQVHVISKEMYERRNF